MNDSGEEQTPEELSALIRKFEEMLQQNKQYFFDASDFEDIVDNYLENRNVDLAIKACNMGISQHPDTVSLQLKMAQMCAFNNDLDRAQELLDKAKSREPNNSDVCLTQGGIYSQLGESEKAIEAYREALKTADQKDDILMFIAMEFKIRENFREAISFFQEALRENPDNEFAMYELAHCHQISDTEEDALPFMREFVDKNPYSLPGWINLGIILNRTRTMAEAREAFDYALAIDENSGSAMFGKAQILVEQGHYAEAIVMFEQLLEADPQDPIGHFMLGDCFEKMQMYDVALPYYVRALDLEPNYTEAWVGKAACHDALEQYQDGIVAVRRALDLEPENLDALYIASEIYSATGMIEEAEVIYRGTLKRHPRDIDTWLSYADMFYSNGEMIRAIETLRDAMLALNGHYAINARMAAYLYTEGQNKEADGFLTDALMVFPGAVEEVFDYNPELKDNPYILALIAQFPNPEK